VFDIGFSELILVMIVGLVVLGPERLPVAVKTVAGWIRAMRSLAASVQNELTQELKLQELQDSIKKVEKSALQDLSPELKASMDELRAAAQAMQKSYQPSDLTSSDNKTTQSDSSDTSVKPVAEEHADSDVVSIEHDIVSIEHSETDTVSPTETKSTTQSGGNN